MVTKGPVPLPRSPRGRPVVVAFGSDPFPLRRRRHRTERRRCRHRPGLPLPTPSTGTVTQAAKMPMVAVTPTEVFEAMHHCIPSEEYP